jgi:MFS family permease
MNSQKPLVIALAGMLSLAVAMGIGRFAFTPLLPMMLHDGVISLPAASWLATANYVGYWVGAVGCTLQPWVWSRLRGLPAVRPTVAMRLGLAATVLLTTAMGSHVAWAWPLWRFLAGVASALVFVYTSAWVLARLSALGTPKLGGLIFVGPGMGIALSGLAATWMVGTGWSAAHAWLAFGALALLLTAWVWAQLGGAPAATGPLQAVPATTWVPLVSCRWPSTSSTTSARATQMPHPSASPTCIPFPSEPT